MRILRLTSHVNAEEWIRVHRPPFWIEILRILATAPYSRFRTFCAAELRKMGASGSDSYFILRERSTRFGIVCWGVDTRLCGNVHESVAKHFSRYRLGEIDIGISLYAVRTRATEASDIDLHLNRSILAVPVVVAALER